MGNSASTSQNNPSDFHQSSEKCKNHLLIVQIENLTVYRNQSACLSFTFTEGKVIENVLPEYSLTEELSFHEGKVKLEYSEDLMFKFKLRSSKIAGLTFINTTSGNELHNILHTKFKENPNINQLPNVNVVMEEVDQNQDKRKSLSYAEENSEISSDWRWKYVFPCDRTSLLQNETGWNNVCSVR